MSVFHVEQFAQFEDAKLEFGSLTFLVGPQATGKSLFLQAWKLTQDAEAIRRGMQRSGFKTQNIEYWSRVYFGEGFEALLKDAILTWEGETFQKERLWETAYRSERGERVFYIPAQRTLIFHQMSWPRFFSEFRTGDPYVVRSFSEQIRGLLEAGLGGEQGLLFPVERRLRRTMRDHLTEHLFRGGQLKIVEELGQRRLMLEIPGGAWLPYMSWSAGQREFIPLLLGLYWLMPRGRTPKRASVEWVVIEEPEMGLHPQAIVDTLLLILELVSRKYKVVLATHSDTVLTLAWVLRFLQDAWAENKKEQIISHKKEQVISQMRKLFGMPAAYPMQKIAEVVFEEGKTRVYYFKPTSERKTQIVDISSLDAFAEQADIADWGGLTAFATRANDVVASMVA